MKKAIIIGAVTASIAAAAASTIFFVVRCKKNKGVV
jgi:hypothetical protein